MTGIPNDPSDDRNSLDALAEEFVARYRRGERPSVTEYTQRRPELAEELRQIIPALVIMEDVRPSTDDLRSQEFDRGVAGGCKLERIGDYRILREVGRGGMGIVFEAEQESLGRHVALKLLPRHALLESRQLERFRREARAAARLHHTNIVPVFDVGEQDGLHYYAMQFIQGLGLDEVVAEVARLRGVKRSASRAEKPDQATADQPNGMYKVSAALAGEVAESLVTGQFRHTDGGSFQLATASPPDDALHDEPRDGSPAVVPDDGPSTGWSADGSSSSIRLPGQDISGSTQWGVKYWESIARIGVQVAEAIAYANSQGVLHRDIKPSNLLLDAHGTVWITDFGLAKSSPPESPSAGWDNLTHTGDVVGTFRYLAPERLCGRADLRSDIYSLGITLYELLTLRHPFAECDHQKLLRQIGDGEPRRPRSLEPALPLDLETIVLKAIAKNPADRYQTADALAADLRRFLEDKPIHARRASRWERLRRWCRRNPMVAGLAASLMVLLAITGLIGGAANFLRLQRDGALASQKRAEAAETEARSLLDRAVEAERELKIRAHLASAAVYRRSGQAGHRFRSLREVTSATALNPSGELRLELRNEAIAAMILPDLNFGKTYDKVWLPGTGSVRIDPERNRYARVDREGNLSLRDLRDDRELARFGGLKSPAFLTFSWTGEFLAASTNLSGGDLQVWRLASRPADVIQTAGLAPSVFAEPLHGVTMFDFSPAGDALAAGHTDGTIRLYELATGELTRQLPARSPLQWIAFGPGGRQLAWCSVGLAAVEVWDVQAGSRRAELRVSEGLPTCVAWHPDGQHLAVGLSSPPNRTEVWNVAAQRRVAAMEGHEQDVVWLSFNDSGELLISASWDGTMRVWDARSGRQIVPWMRAASGPIDGRWLGFMMNGTNVSLVELVSGLGYRTLMATSNAGKDVCRSGAFSHDGRLLAVATSESVRLLEIPAGREVGLLPVEGSESVCFLPHDSELVTSGLDGLIRWPLRRDSADSSRLLIGPPQRVPLDVVPTATAVAADGRMAIVASEASGSVQRVDLATNTVAKQLAVHRQMGRATLHPRGHQAATYGWHSPTVNVWDTRTAELLQQLPLGVQTHAYYSPDGRSLITSRGDEYCFWDPVTWRVQRRVPREGCPFPSPVAFSPDGTLLAMELSPAVIHLLDYQSGRTLARLEDPANDRPSWFDFTPDGTTLVVLSRFGGTIHFWDLRAIRAQLSAIGLDWEPTTGSPVAATSDDAAPASFDPLQVNLDIGDLDRWQKPRRADGHYQRARQRELAQQWQQAIAEYQQSLAIDPDDPRHNNDYAWLLATCPDAQFRDPPRAVELGRRAVQFNPDKAAYHNTLGVACYRSGDWRSAIVELSRAEELEPGTWFAHNALFLAMAHWQLGERDPAQQWYAKAVRWLEENRAVTSQHAVELDRFRSEAEKLVSSEPAALLDRN